MTQNDLTPSNAYTPAASPSAVAAPSGPPSAPRMVTRICTALAVVLSLGLFLSRSFAQQFDFGVANILTLIMGFFAWLSLIIGLATSKLPRWYWRTAALAPIILVAVAMSLLRIVRIDGELLPQFESRWSTGVELTENADSHTGHAVDPQLLEPRATDFTQFLGSDRNGSVLGVSLETDWKANPPQILWKQSLGAGWSGFAVQGDVAVTLEQREQEQWISAYEVESGRMLWHTAVPGYHFNVMGGAGPRSTPTIDGGRVYAHMASGQLVCVDLDTGKQLWEVDLLRIGGWDQSTAEAAVAWGRAGSPLVTNGKVIVPLGGPSPEGRSLIAINSEDGNILWRAGEDQISYSSPSLMTIKGVEQIVMVNENTVTGHDIELGTVLWTIPWAGQSNGAANVSQTTQLSDERLLFSKGYSQGAQVVEFSRDESRGEAKAWTFEVIWRDASVLKTKFTSPVVVGEYAYGLSDGILECVRLSDGERQWKKGRYRQGQLLLVGDVLLITSESGAVVLVAADPTKFNELAKLDVIGDVTWNTPALSGDRLLIRNAEEAACLRLPTRSSETSPISSPSPKAL